MFFNELNHVGIYYTLWSSNVHTDPPLLSVKQEEKGIYYYTYIYLYYTMVLLTTL